MLPALAALIGVGFYLSGGRYISTDNAYVGAQKVLITPDISGKVAHVAVHRRPARQCRRRAVRRSIPCRSGSRCSRRRRKLEAARTDYAKSQEQPRLADARSSSWRRRTSTLKQRDVDRKSHAARKPRRLAGRRRQLAMAGW